MIFRTFGQPHGLWIRRCALWAVACTAAAGAGTLAGLQPGAAQDAASAEKGSTPAEKEKPAANAPIFFLRDQSKIAGMPKFETLEVQTQYGNLAVPREQLVRIRFARRIASELRDQIATHIGNLGNEDFDRREEATAKLREIGAPAIEALRAAAKSPSDEVKSRATVLLEEIEKQGAEGKPEADASVAPMRGSDDEVVTHRMTIKGHISVTEFVIESRYGELKVATDDLTAAVFRAAGPQATKVEIAPSFQPPGNWLDTKFDVEKNQKLKIEASGTLNVRNYGISSGPDGNRDWGGASFNNFPMLSLVGKIGKRGQPFLVGNGYTGKSKDAGRLYLAIVTFSPYPSGVTGSYKAVVQASGSE